MGGIGAARAATEACSIDYRVSRQRKWRGCGVSPCAPVWAGDFRQLPAAEPVGVPSKAESRPAPLELV